MVYWNGDDEDLDDNWPDELGEHIKPVPKDSYEILNPRQRVMYAGKRRKFFNWFVTEGKDPVKGKGYSPASLPSTSCRLDQFYRWVWARDGFRLEVGSDYCDEYVTDNIAKGEWSENAKRKTTNALAILMRYEHDIEWESPVEWDDDDPSSPSDYLDMSELQKIRAASTELGSVPSPNGLTLEEIDEWKAHLAQRWEIPKTEISKEDFATANSWKIPSLVAVSLSVGPRPCEVYEWTTDIFRKEEGSKGKLVIPKELVKKHEDSEKKRWECTLSYTATDLLDRWLKERKQYDIYTDDEEYDYTDRIWLTREGNPYDRQSLRRLMIRLMDEAGIRTEGRETGWYLIRRGVATYMANSPDTTLETVMKQLRILSYDTAARYVQVDDDHLRDKVLV